MAAPALVLVGLPNRPGRKRFTGKPCPMMRSSRLSRRSNVNGPSGRDGQNCAPVHLQPGSVASHLILRSRVCYRWKPTSTGQKAKARVVVAGFKDPHLPVFTRDAPVLARSSLHLLLQWAATFQVKLWNADAKSAFLQGDPDCERPEPIFMKPPQEPPGFAGSSRMASENLALPPLRAGVRAI